MNLRMRYIKDYFAQRKVRAVIAWIAEIALVIALAAFLAFFFGQKVTMQEGSMEPTITAGEEILVNKASYALGSPKRGDIIVFRSSDDEKSSLHIKRVIGLPGETIQIRDGQILIDGQTYIEERELPAITDPGLAEDEITLDSGEFSYWEITGTTVRTAAMWIWEQSRRRILSESSGWWFPPGRNLVF